MRKESVGRVNRFNYAVESITVNEDYEHSHSHSKGRRYQEYRIPSGENESNANNRPLLHQPSRLKKDYLYANSNERLDCRRVLNSRNFNTSF
jgi:hypothetical protein